MRWLIPFFTVFLMVGLAVPDAEARRFGGGKAFGSAPAHKSQPAQRQQSQDQQAAPRNQQQPGATSGAGRWLGPLAGIAAGGLLASMLFGDGFQGIQLLDMLIFGLIAFMLFKLFTRRHASQPQPQPAGGGQFRQAPMEPTRPTPMASGSVVASAAPVNTPAWFDSERFLRGAEEHFFTLQRHWRDNDVEGMAEYVDPQLLQELQATRSDNPPTANGFVEQLQVRLEGVDEIDGRAIATVGFTGLDRDAPEDDGTWFDESWRLERAAGENQPWIICGIRQNS
ncbi:Tim44 domain-containing protein [Pseudomonas saliphila]|uniref:Tim44 domain-containing protein n=1 Tax=Pseudomonas saliphila TaxID=2586906 RepID=UPI00123BC1E8|nr:TIM44-like domain-containing protein [Pseudomonas saliphila]